eukprot:3183129-Rhodomonas_salina.2
MRLSGIRYCPAYAPMPCAVLSQCMRLPDWEGWVGKASVGRREGARGEIKCENPRSPYSLYWIVPGMRSFAFDFAVGGGAHRTARQKNNELCTQTSSVTAS